MNTRGLALDPHGFLPAGRHRATLSEVEAALVSPAMPNVDLRRAVMSGVAAWALMARYLLGTGRCWLSGGFVSLCEPDDHALVAYLPDDEELAGAAVKSGFGLDLVTLHSVSYAGPGSGGVFAERRPVGGLVDALIGDREIEGTLARAFAIVIDPDGHPSGTTKGFVEVRL